MMTCDDLKCRAAGIIPVNRAAACVSNMRRLHEARRLTSSHFPAEPTTGRRDDINLGLWKRRGRDAH